MRAIDTNVLVRLITRDDPKQAQAVEEFIAAGAWISHLILAETVWVLDSVYERSPQQIITAVSMLLEHNELSIQDPDVVAAALDNYRKRPTVGFSDCLVLEIARKADNTPLGSFDRTLAKLPDAVLIRTT